MDKLHNLIERLPLDNKLIVSTVTSVVTYLLTLLVTKSGLDLNAVVIPPYTIAALVSAVAAAAAALVSGYFYPNEGTVLRQADQENGNPDPALLSQHGVEVNDA